MKFQSIFAAVLVALSFPVVAAESGTDGGAELPAQVDSILADCNGEPILLSDVLKESATQERSIHASCSGEAAQKAIMELRRQVVDQLIDRRLVKADFAVRKLQLPEQMVDNMLDDFAAANGCRTRSELEAKLIVGNMTIEKLREEARDRIIYQAMIVSMTRQRIYISPKRQYEYYQAHPERFSEPEKWELSLIRIGGDREKRAEVLTALAAEFQTGTVGFGELAKRYSDGPNAATGGSLGWIARNQLRAEFAKTLAEPVVGRIAGPVELEEGTYYLMLTGIRPGEKREFRAVAGEIRDCMEKEASKRAYDEYVGKLRSEAEIRYYF